MKTSIPAVAQALTGSVEFWDFQLYVCHVDFQHLSFDTFKAMVLSFR